jgi:hypothetical protein
VLLILLADEQAQDSRTPRKLNTAANSGGHIIRKREFPCTFCF